MGKILQRLQEHVKHWTKPRTVQKPHPKEFTLEKQHLSSSHAELVKWSHLSLWSTKSDGLVHSQAHFLHLCWLLGSSARIWKVKEEL